MASPFMYMQIPGIAVVWGLYAVILFSHKLLTFTSYFALRISYFPLTLINIKPILLNSKGQMHGLFSGSESRDNEKSNAIGFVNQLRNWGSGSAERYGLRKGRWLFEPRCGSGCHDHCPEKRGFLTGWFYHVETGWKVWTERAFRRRIPFTYYSHKLS